jgi:hypothetical protein
LLLRIEFMLAFALAQNDWVVDFGNYIDVLTTESLTDCLRLIEAVLMGIWVWMAVYSPLP